MSITTKEIAKLAGVSQSTVSRCLNDSSLISQQTKDKVNRIAREQGFEFNANARSLSTRKTGTIGVIYPEDFSHFSNSLYLNSLHDQLRERLEKENLDLIISFAVNSCTGISNIKRLAARKKVDGFIIVRGEIDQDTLSYLKKSRTPFIYMHHIADQESSDDYDAIGTDHEYGGYLAAQYLIGLGHKKILCISSYGIGREFEERTKGFKAAFKDNGMTCDAPVLFGDMSFGSGYEITSRVNPIKTGCTAIFAQNDMMALGAIECLKEKGCRVPEDISIIGYDDIELCTYFHPYLTTIHQPREEIAMLTCDRLMELIQSDGRKQKKRIMIQPRLVVRNSCRKI